MSRDNGRGWDIQVEDIPEAEVPHLKVSGENLGSRKFEYTFEDKKVTIPQEMHDQYKAVMNPGIPFRVRWRNFITAENKLGRGAKKLKDFALLFAPKWVRVGYNTVGEFIVNEIESDMPNTEESKSTGKSSTVITFGLLFLAGLFMQLGWLPADMVELSPDAAWVATASGAVGVILRLITDKPVKLGKSLRRILNRKE